MSLAPVRRPIGKGNIKKGICQNHNYLNTDTGETGDCPMCAPDKIQSINVQRLSDFKCTQCGSRLTPVRVIDWKEILMYIILIVLIGGGAFAFLMNKERTKVKRKVEATIIVTPSTTTDTVGKTITLIAKVTPENSPVRWESSDNKIATVDGNGIVTLLKKGNVQIKVSLNDTVNASSKITVIEKNNGSGDPIRVFGGAASLSGNTITFHRGYTLDLHTFDGDELLIGSGDKIVEAKIQNGCLMSGIYVSSTGEERYISGLNNRLY